MTEGLLSASRKASLYRSPIDLRFILFIPRQPHTLTQQMKAHTPMAPFIGFLEMESVEAFFILGSMLLFQIQYLMN